MSTTAFVADIRSHHRAAADKLASSKGGKGAQFDAARNGLYIAADTLDTAEDLLNLSTYCWYCADNASTENGARVLNDLALKMHRKFRNLNA